MNNLCFINKFTASFGRASGAKALAFGVATVFSTTAIANDYPTKPIRLVVGFSPGGTTDIMARLIASQMSTFLGQPIVIDNKSGASGTIAADAVAKAPADGYTIMYTTTTVHGITPSLFTKLPYDPIKDFAPISLVNKSTMVLLANNDLPTQKVSDIIALAKAKPGQLAYASAGPGSTAHLAAVLFAKQAQIDMLHVPYRGGGSAIPSVMSGEVQLTFDNISSTRGVISSKRARAIAVTSPQRAPSLPDVPTFAESGLPGFTLYSWGGLVAPANTPKDVIRKLNEAANRALKTNEVRTAMLKGDSEPQGGTPEEFWAFILKEQKLWGEAVRLTGTKLD